jgi:flagellar biosynthesis protein FlhG
MKNDQAIQLRCMAREAATVRAPDTVQPRRLVVAGGHGGVGTTTLAVNLAIALARRQCRPVLVDADPQAAGATLLCRSRQGPTVTDVLSARRTVRETLQPGPAGIDVLPGDWPPAGAWDCPGEAHRRLIDELAGLGPRADCIVVDAGSGCGRMTRRWWLAADLLLLVTSPELPGVMNTYASIKALAAGGETPPIHALVNLAPSVAAADEVGVRLRRACLRLLGLRLHDAGYLPRAAEVAEAGRRGEPFVLVVSDGPAVRHLGRLADRLAATVCHQRGEN